MNIRLSTAALLLASILFLIIGVNTHDPFQLLLGTIAFGMGGVSLVRDQKPQ